MADAGQDRLGNVQAFGCGVIRRVLIVGYGSIGRRHLRVVRESLPAADIRVLRHKAGAPTPELANGCFDTIAEATSFSPDVAVIANPAPFHVATGMALVDVGCHLLIEKPLSDSLLDVAVLIGRARDRGVVLQVGYNLRFLPSLGKFRELISAGRIGRVLSVRCEIGQYLPSWRPDADYRNTVSARKALGGGVLLELSHEFDYLSWLFGPVRWVNAYLGTHGDLEVDVEDTAHLILGFGPGDDGRALVASLSLDFVRRDTTRQCVAIGATGSLRWNALGGSVEEWEADGTTWHSLFEYPQQRDDSYRAQWQHFLDRVRDGGMPLSGGTEGLATMEVIDAARKSAVASGTRVWVTTSERG